MEPDGAGSGRLVSVDEAINEVGIGRAQYNMLIICGLSFCADAAEVTFLSFVTEVLRCEWDLSAKQETLIMSMVFAGQIVGAPSWGYLADKCGRRLAFIWSSGVIAISGLVTALSVNYSMFMVTSFIVGVGIGGLPIGFDILVESIPSKSRGNFSILIQYFWTFGSMYVNFCAWMLLESQGWRIFTASAALPVLISLTLAIFFLPESPRWLVEEDHREEALVILNQWSKKNGAEKSFAGLARHAADEHMDITHLCRNSQLRVHTLSMFVVWFAFGIIYYGIVLILPRIAESGEGSDSKAGSADCNLNFNFGELVTSACTEVVGVTAALIMIENPGRRCTQMVFYVITGVAVFVLSFRSLDTQVLVFIGSIGRIAVMSASCATWVHTPELFPTAVRIQAHGVLSLAARIGATLAPFIISDMVPPLVCGSIMAVLSIAAVLGQSFLPETAGKDLEDIFLAPGHSDLDEKLKPDEDEDEGEDEDDEEEDEGGCGCE